MSADPRLRGALLMPLSALAVHQLRYYVAFGAGAGSRLARDGHAYLSTAAPLFALAAAIAVGTLVGAAARAWQSGVPGRPRRLSVLRLWLLCVAALVCIYCVQELLESGFVSSHPGGLAGVFGSGGWIALPAAGLVAGALCLALKLSEALLVLASRQHRVRRTTLDAGAPRLRPGWARPRRLLPQSGLAAGRAPPLPGLHPITLS